MAAISHQPISSHVLLKPAGTKFGSRGRNTELTAASPARLTQMAGGLAVELAIMIAFETVLVAATVDKPAKASINVLPGP